MAPNISKRHYLRWLPDPIPNEDNTSTTVTTSGGNRFVDLRIFKNPSNGIVFKGVAPLSQLEWGFAGTSSSTLKPGTNGALVTHSKWNHWIDSRTPNAESVQDEGIMQPLPNGDTLETGSMINPATGRKTAYEEKWSDVALQSTGRKDGKVGCVVLQLHNDAEKARGMVVRVGQVCQGIMRVGEKLTVEQWVWSEEESKSTWARRVRMGDLWMPCGLAMEPAKLVMGGKVAFGDYEWEVVELTEA
ncbi:unnamed protein product [Zymoseptoria tritici ST99CH_1E4]|uniref:Protein HRI1 n=1 Tax=Zymoseptoria tritici ST99CH_1E4 TaxID=1276532 RepID=A0A2H1FWX3_ZYMTR|nr:unnamed protein product [Zymoseptoria tritici ST99CH_1E4]